MLLSRYPLSYVEMCSCMHMLYRKQLLYQGARSGKCLRCRLNVCMGGGRGSYRPRSPQARHLLATRLRLNILHCYLSIDRRGAVGDWRKSRTSASHCHRMCLLIVHIEYLTASTISSYQHGSQRWQKGLLRRRAEVQAEEEVDTQCLC